MISSCDVAVEPATLRNAAVLSNLLELYSHDLSDVFALEPGADGRFGYEKLPLYWSEPENRFPFPLRFFHREIHLLPVKALVLEESLIFRYPEVLQEHLRNLRQRNPVVAKWTLLRAREHRAAPVDQHRQRHRRIDESHHRHLHRRDEEQNHEQNQNPFLRATARGESFYAFPSTA